MAFRSSHYFRGDAMDDYLTSLALFRKPVAMDETSLFRATSEQIYSTQIFHLQLQQCCVSYIGRHAEKFENLNQVRAYIQALAILYKRDFLIYQEIAKPPVNVTNFGFPRKIILCESFGNHFDCVYPRSFQQKAAICQSVTYEILYKGVFRMETEVAAAVGLIRKQNQRYSRGLATFSMPSPIGFPAMPSSPTRGFYESDQMCCSYYDVMNVSADAPFNAIADPTPRNQGAPIQVAGRSGVTQTQPPSYYLGAPATAIPRRATRQASLPQDDAVRDREMQMAITGPPFPYKVAKALDPVVYRNIEYDVWLDERKARFRSAHSFFKNGPYPVGTSCLVRLDDSDTHVYSGIVQEVDPSGESVIVFLPELREKKKVHLDRLEGEPRNFTPSSAPPMPHYQCQGRSRHPTWAPSAQPPQIQANGSLSWPMTTVVNNWQQAPPQPPPNHQFQTPAATDSNSKNRPVSNYGESTTPRNGATAVSTPCVRYPLPQVPFVPVFQPPANHIQQPNFYWQNHLAMQQASPQQINYTPANFNQQQQGPLAVSDQQPNAEDLTTLRQFYDLGGCEYFRRFLAANQQQIARPVLVQQQQQYQPYEPQAMMAHQRESVADSQIAIQSPLQQMQLQQQQQIWPQ